MRVKMSKQPPPAPTASAIGPCPTVIQIVGRPGTGSLPSTIAPPPLWVLPFKFSQFSQTDGIVNALPCLFHLQKLYNVLTTQMMYLLDEVKQEYSIRNTYHPPYFYIQNRV